MIPGYAEIFAFPVLVSLVCVAIGCVFLVVDLGQPGVFWRVWTTSKSIIKWGATFLVIAAVFALLFSSRSSATRGRCSRGCRAS